MMLKINETFYLKPALFIFKILIHLLYSALTKNVLLLASEDSSHKLYCENWNSTIIIHGDSLEKLVQATFQPFPNYEKCFTHYYAYLHLLKPKCFKCNINDGHGINYKKVEHYNQERQSYEVSFTGLDVGYYCILFQPCDHNCYERLLQSEVVKIGEKPTVSSKHNDMKESPSNKLPDIAYMSILLFLTIICIIIIYWNYRHRKLRTIVEPDIVVEKGESLPFLTPSDTEVSIFYYPDEDIRRLVDCLADFLQKCAEFSVLVVDDRCPEIHFNPISWLDTILQSCSTICGKCNCNKRFIIVMTEQVIKYMHSLSKVTDTLSELTDDIHADWFHYGLNRILCDWSKCLKDYNHFFVIYFDDKLYAEENNANSTLVPNVRFNIQHHVVKLCQELNYSFNDASLKRELVKCLDQHPLRNIV